MTLHRALADPDAQFEQFATDALRAPQPILFRHPFDQRDRRRGYLWPLQGCRRPDTPDEAGPVAMPARQCVRLDDEQRGSPAMRQACQERQRHTIAGCEGGLRDLALQHDELPPRERVLGHPCGFAHGYVGHRSMHGGPGRGLGPPQETSMDGVRAIIRTLL